MEDESTKTRAGNLREGATPAERHLWQHLRRTDTGFKFSRQIRIGHYIADFCCRSRKVVVELDGSSHFGLEGYDVQRVSDIESAGYVVLRYSNEDVLCNIRVVIADIKRVCEERPQLRY